MRSLQNVEIVKIHCSLRVMAFSNKCLLFCFHGRGDFALAGKPSVQEDKQRISGEEMHTMISYTIALYG